jgi:pimeloyl-ACP methyl ester carboxylesterase
MIQRLLLLPGMDGTGELFADFIDALPASCRANALSYPTDVCLNYRDLETLVAETAPANESFVLVAESFSTPLAIRFAASNPLNLRGLLLCAGFASSPLKGWKCALASVIGRALPFKGLSSGVARRFLVGPDAPEASISRVRTAIRQVKLKVLRHRLRNVLTCDEREALAEISIPILYLRAKRDRLVPLASLEEMLHVRPEIEIAEIEGPHLLLQAKPKASAEVVMQFIGSLG